MVIQGIRYPSDFEAKKAMIEAGKLFGEKGYFTGRDGTISMRTGPDAVWFTSKDSRKYKLSQEDFIRSNLSGKTSFLGKTEALPDDQDIHADIYHGNSDVRAILHVHPPEITAMGLKGCGASNADFSPAVKDLGEIPCVRMEEFSSYAGSLSKKYNGVILPKNGCFLWAPSLDEAIDFLEALLFYEKVKKASGCCEHKAGCSACDRKTTCGKANANISGLSAENRSTEHFEKSVTTMEDGITPIIKPGDRNGFSLPDGTEKRKVEPNTVKQERSLTGKYNAHPVTTSAPSNAQFLKNNYSPYQTGTRTAEVTVGRPPFNSALTHDDRGEKPSGSTAFTGSTESGAVVGSSGRFYGYTYKRPEGSHESAERTITPSVSIKAQADMHPEKSTGTQSDEKQYGTRFEHSSAVNVAMMHGTEAASAQCPVNVFPKEEGLESGTAVKDAPKQAAMDEVIRRMIGSMK